MIRLFKHYVPHAVLLLGLFDVILLIAAAEFGWVYRADQIGMTVEPIHTRIPQLLSFAGSLETAMIAVGVYGAASLQSLRHAAARILVAVSLGIVLVVSTVLIYLVLQSTGVFDRLDALLADILSSGDEKPFSISESFSLLTVTFFAFIVAVLNIVVGTALGAITSILYNFSVRLTGGLLVGFTNN